MSHSNWRLDIVVEIRERMTSSIFDLSGRIAAQATMVGLCADAKLGTVGLPTRRGQSAGNLPGSVLTRYDLLGTYVHGRLQYAYY